MPLIMPEHEKIPSIFFTHHKCATTWLTHILEGYSITRNLSLFSTHLSEFPAPSDKRCDILLFTNSNYEFCAHTCLPWLDSVSIPALHVIRNPLDLVVSGYYSHLETHHVGGWAELARQRDVLRCLDKTSGMLATWVFLERSDFHPGAVGPLFALRRWNFDDERIKTVCMEDLVDDQELLRSLLHPRLGDDPTDIISQATFEKLSGGRLRGVIDNKNHFRCGERNQWVHEMDFSLAQAIYHEYRAIIDTYYPEVEPLLARQILRNCGKV